MKTLAILAAICVLALGSLGQAQKDESPTRPDIDKDIPLSEAIRRANEKFPDAQPLTEAEIVAAVRAIKVAHPDIRDDTYKIYLRIVKEHVLPAGMYFSQITNCKNEYGEFEVDWKDLRYRGRPATAEEQKEFQSRAAGKLQGDFSKSYVDGYGYRIRARFIATR